MGAECSSPLPNLPNNNYACISIFNFDSILVMYTGKSELEAVRNAIISNWRRGIQREVYKFEEDENNPTRFNCVKFKLNGNPFITGRGKDQAIQCRLMAAAILKSLYNLGWKVLVSSDLSRLYDYNTWIFQRQILQQNPYPMFSVGLSSTDKLQINDCPENLQDVILQICKDVWIKGIQNTEKSGRTFEIILNGNPWQWVDKPESCSSRQMLKEIIQQMSARQYDLYANSNLRGTADTLFFNYNPSLQGEQDFLVVSLNRTDRIRLIKAPAHICECLKETVSLHWPYGLQDVKDDEVCYELKLKGNPWLADGQEAIYSRHLIVKIMERLASVGYFVITGLDMSRKVNDKSVLLFRRGAPLITPFMCISLNQTDKIRFIDSPQNVTEAGRSIIQYWPLGLQEEAIKHDGVTYEAKLKGNPWSHMYKSHGIHGRALLLGILCNMYSLGWRLVCSADVSAKYVHQDNGPDYPIDVHSWWFMYDEMMLSHAHMQTQAVYQQVNPNYPSPSGTQYPDSPPPAYNPQFMQPPPEYMKPPY